MAFDDLRNINQQIRDWLMLEPGKESLSLPPISKKTRAAVHLLAQAYSLSSHSIGKGKERFPILERTPLSSVIGCDEGRIRAILRSDEKDGPLPRWRTEKQEAKRRARVYGQSSSGVRIVGESAKKLGDDNIGYKLLARMGWNEGMKMGLTGGLEEPIAAKIRSKGSGLGA
ncbi:hypothetical protein BT69DRAFT_1362156 [Atractiella rhizophila]|nr:hypothetical protein BT69DRAFT_1362156 [Atractiella rhizophila]